MMMPSRKYASLNFAKLFFINLMNAFSSCSFVNKIILKLIYFKNRRRKLQMNHFSKYKIVLFLRVKETMRKRVSCIAFCSHCLKFLSTNRTSIYLKITLDRRTTMFFSCFVILFFLLLMNIIV